MVTYAGKNGMEIHAGLYSDLIRLGRICLSAARPAGPPLPHHHHQFLTNVYGR